MLEPGRWNVGGSVAVGLALAVAVALVGLWVVVDFGWSLAATSCASGLFFIAASQAGVTLTWWWMYTRRPVAPDKTTSNVRNAKHSPEYLH